jgi:hypothetical protein
VLPEENLMTIRLSANQTKLILAGLDVIVGRYRHFLRTGEPYRPLDTSCGTSEASDASLMAKLMCLRDRLAAHCHRGRVRLDWQELSCCAFSVRVGSRLSVLSAPQTRASRARLLRKLEACRKRAKRLYISEHGCASYREGRARWLKHIPVIKSLIRPPKANRMNFLSGYHKCVLNELLASTHPALSARGASPQEARAIVRRGIRYVRRGRYSFGVRTLREDPALAQEFFSGLYARAKKLQS